MKKLLVLIAVLIAAPLVKAEGPYPVHLDCSTGSQQAPVADRLCTAVSREIGRNSHRYYEVGSAGKVHWTISMISINVLDDEKGAIATGITLSITYPDAPDTLVNSYVFITGTNKVTDQAESIFAAIDTDVRKMENIVDSKSPSVSQ